MLEKLNEAGQVGSVAKLKGYWYCPGCNIPLGIAPIGPSDFIISYLSLQYCILATVCGPLLKYNGFCLAENCPN